MRKFLFYFLMIILFIISGICGYGVVRKYWNKPMDEIQFEKCEDIILEVFYNGVQSLENTEDYHVEIDSGDIVVSINGKRYEGYVVGNINNGEISVKRENERNERILFNICLVIFGCIIVMFVYIFGFIILSGFFIDRME